MREYVCPTLPEELDTPENRMVMDVLASHDGLMTASDIGKSCGITTQRASATARGLVARGYVSVFKKVIHGKGTMNAYQINLEKIYENT